MSGKPVFIDSTCLFSQASLLDSISDPREDVVSFLGSSFDFAWSNKQIAEYSFLVSAQNSSLAPQDPAKLYSLDSPVAQALIKERDLLLETIDKLKDNGLVKIYDFDDLLVDPSGNEVVPYEDSLAKKTHDLKMKVLKSSRDTQRELNLVPSDIEIVAYAVANNALYHSENPKISDGTMAKIMGASVFSLGSYSFEGIDSVQIGDIVEFVEDKSSYIERVCGQVSKRVRNILVVSANILSNFNPYAAYGMAAFNSVKDVYKLVREWDYVDKVAIVEARSKVIPQGSMKSLIDGFSAYRMNPIKPERDL